MSDFRLLELSSPARLDGPQAWAYAGYSNVDGIASAFASGEPRVGYRVAEVITDLNFHEDVLNRIVVAVVGEEETPDAVVGFANVGLGMRDNLDSADMTIVVHPDYRRQGIGTKLLEWAEAQAQAANRHSLQSYCRGSLIPEGAVVVEAPSGGAIPADNPGVVFAQKHGYKLEQIERFSRLDVPMHEATVHGLVSEAREHAVGYRVHFWTGQPDPEWLAAFGVLRSKASGDAPAGGMAWEEEIYDAERIVRWAEEARAAGLERMYAVTEHVKSGDLVAASYLSLPTEPTDYCHQNYTIVLKAHYGHRLGLLVKMENYLALRQTHPEIKHVLTWNAEENRPMLRINELMGFYPIAYNGEVQKKVA